MLQCNILSKKIIVNIVKKFQKFKKFFVNHVNHVETSIRLRYATISSTSNSEMELNLQITFLSFALGRCDRHSPFFI